MTTVLELAILMALRVHGRSDAVQVARATACSEAEAAAALATLQARGAVTPAARGAASASSPALATLTDAGRAELTALLAAEPLDRPALARLYDRFLVADDELKAAITAWQLASALDKPAAQDRVMAAAATAGGVAAALAEIAPRLAPYPRRMRGGGGDRNRRRALRCEPPRRLAPPGVVRAPRGRARDARPEPRDVIGRIA